MDLKQSLRFAQTAYYLFPTSHRINDYYLRKPHSELGQIQSKHNLLYHFQLNFSAQKATNDGLLGRNPVKTQFILLLSTKFFGPKGNK
jgi:hypothetical protein